MNSLLDLSVWKTTPLGRGAELYMVALASNEPLPALAGVAYLAPVEQLREWVERVAALEQALERRDAVQLREWVERVAALEDALERRDAELATRAAAATLGRRWRALPSVLNTRFRGGVRLGRGIASSLDGRLRTRRRYRRRSAAVLFVSGAPDVSVRYRCNHQAEQLELLGGTTTVVRHGDCDLVEALERHELVVLHRVPWGDDVSRLIDRAQQVGKEVLFDTDDLVFEPDALSDVAALSELPPDDATLYVEGVHRYRRTLEHCKGATASTEPLAERIRGLGVPAVTTPNVASNAMVETGSRLVANGASDAGRVTVGYLSGTATHRQDFAVAAKAVLATLRDRPEAELCIVGPLRVDDSLASLDDERVKFMPLQPWSHLADIQASIDINLAPLEPDNAFTECKSSVKWLEAALVARPTVASPRPDFRRVIETGENGLLAESPGEWYEALAALLDDSSLRHRLGERARQAALSTHTTKAQSLSYLKALRHLTSRPEAPLTINWILYSPISQNGGGYRNIFRIASVLGERGHRQRFIVKPVAHLHGKSREEIVQFIEGAFGIPPNAEVLIEHHEIPEADISLATYWPTAYTVAEHPLSRFKGYFIQDFEPSFHEDSPHEYRRAELTYSLPLRRICLGEHLARRIQELTGVPSTAVDFALDSHFTMTRSPAEREGIPCVLFFARPSLPRRGYEVGVNALAELKRRHPEVDILFFGSRTEELGAVPFQFRNLGVIDAAAVAKAMNDAHILLTFSLTNISNVPFEGMACGCGVVELDSPNVSTMIAAGENCLLAPFEAGALADALSRLVEEPDLRIRLAQRGAADMAGRNWERTGSMFENALRELCFLPTAARRAGLDVVGGRRTAVHESAENKVSS